MEIMSQKENQLLLAFSNCQKPEDVYNKIIEIGQSEIKKDFIWKEDIYLVPGCQSLLYLYAEEKGGKLFFKAYSDALISMGLAQLLVEYYSGETYETILKSPPAFLDKLNISNSLTPSRVNGLYNIHLKMKQKALQCLVANSTENN